MVLNLTQKTTDFLPRLRLALGHMYVMAEGNCSQSFPYLPFSSVFSVVSDTQLEGEGKGSLKAPQGTPGSRRPLKPPPAGLRSLLSHLPAASRCT